MLAAVGAGRAGQSASRTARSGRSWRRTVGRHQPRHATPAAEQRRGVEVLGRVALPHPYTEEQPVGGPSQGLAPRHGLTWSDDQPVDEAVRDPASVGQPHDHVARPRHPAREHHHPGRHRGDHRVGRGPVLEAAMPGTPRARRGFERADHGGVDRWRPAQRHRHQQRGDHAATAEVRRRRWRTGGRAGAAPPWCGSATRGSR